MKFKTTSPVKPAARPLDCFKVKLIFSFNRYLPDMYEYVYVPKKNIDDLEQFIKDLNYYFDNEDWDHDCGNGTCIEKYVGNSMDPYKWHDYKGISFEWPLVEDLPVELRNFEVTYFPATGTECNIEYSIIETNTQLEVNNG